jgi:branched-chain amino acid transport system substrate-binding protein
MPERISRRTFLQRSFLGGSALLGLPLLGACAPQTPPAPAAGAAQRATPAQGATAATAPAPQSTPLRIGLGAPATGPLVGIAPEMQAGAELALRDVRRQVLGMPVEILFEDTEGKPDVALRKLDKLVTRDGCRFVTGFASSAEALAVADKLPQLQAVYIATVSQTTKLTGEACNRYVFRAALNDAQYVNLIRLYVEQSAQLKGAKWAILAADYEFGRDVAATFKSRTSAQVAMEEYVPVGSKDFATYINKLQSAKPDALFLPLVGQDVINFVKQAGGHGLLRQTQVLIPTILFEFALRALGESAVGLRCVTNYTWTIDTPQNAAFAEGYKQLVSELRPGTFAANTYVAVRMLLAAIERVGAPDPERVIPALEALEYQAPWTTIRFRKGDHQALMEGYVTEVVRHSGSPYGVALQVHYKASGDQLTPPLEQTGCKGL